MWRTRHWCVAAGRSTYPSPHTWTQSLLQLERDSTAGMTFPDLSANNSGGLWTLCLRSTGTLINICVLMWLTPGTGSTFTHKIGTINWWIYLFKYVIWIFWMHGILRALVITLNRWGTRSVAQMASFTQTWVILHEWICGQEHTTAWVLCKIVSWSLRNHDWQNNICKSFSTFDNNAMHINSIKF